MNLLATISLATALAMDAFAASLSLGACIRDKKTQRKIALYCAAFFGFFQFAMVAIGWLLAGTFITKISAIDHYVAFGLLLFIGVCMIYEAIKGEGNRPLYNIRAILVLAIATSIDAMAAGISQRTIDEPLLLLAVLTGVITFTLSGLGVLIACKLSSEKYSRIFDAVGGIVLVILGIKILIEHLLQ